MEIRINADHHLNRAQTAPQAPRESSRADTQPPRGAEQAAVISERLKAQMQKLRPSESEKQQLRDIKEARDLLKLTAPKIVSDARTALLAQANASTQSAVALLSG